MRGDGVDSALISCEYKRVFTLASPLADCASLSCWFVNPPSDPTLDPNLIQHLGSLRSDLLPAEGIAILPPIEDIVSPAWKLPAAVPPAPLLAVRDGERPCMW